MPQEFQKCPHYAEISQSPEAINKGLYRKCSQNSMSINRKSPLNESQLTGFNCISGEWNTLPTNCFPYLHQHLNWNPIKKIPIYNSHFINNSYILPSQFYQFLYLSSLMTSSLKHTTHSQLWLHFGPGGYSHVKGYGDVLPKGLLLNQKSLDMGPILVQKNP